MPIRGRELLHEGEERNKKDPCVSSQGMPSSDMVLGVLSLPLPERHHSVYHHRSGSHSVLLSEGSLHIHCHAFQPMQLFSR